MPVVFTIFAAILGAIIGSFLNVVILRHNTHLKSKRSFCFSCGHVLHPSELVPIFSYIFLLGKCAKCKSKISPQYVFVEIFSAVMSVIAFRLSFGLPFELMLVHYAVIFALFSFLVCIFVYDLRHKIIPNEWTLAALLISLVFSIFFGVGLKLAILGMIFVPVPLLLTYALSKGKAMGFGDVKFATAIGALLGASGGIAALMMSFWIGGICGVYLLLHYPKKVNKKTEIPFGPFLIIATLFAFIFSIRIDTILVWVSTILN
jgi:prepilin signal peptidase PulO-like enzyme (type II secretory pathway)